MDPNIDCMHKIEIGQHGLCGWCRAEYKEDPTAWLEYGPHRRGIANWEALQREMADRQDETTQE